MNRTRIKICGLTSAKDAQAAVDAGADALGLVFAPQSPRCLTIEQAVRICDAIPPFVSTVGLFMDAPADQLREVLAAVRIDCLQFHGVETDSYCRRFQHPYIKAVAMSAAGDDSNPVNAVDRWFSEFPGAAALLFDSHQPGQAGGTGRVFDWGRIQIGGDRPIILAGGLNAGNVAQAVERVRPYAVDVSSGVEKRPGIKDHEQLRLFCTEVKRADRNR